MVWAKFRAFGFVKSQNVNRRTAHMQYMGDLTNVTTIIEILRLATIMTNEILRIQLENVLMMA